STATSGLAPLAAMANSVCCPSGAESGGVQVSGSSPNEMVRLTNSAVSATEQSSSHSHRRVVKSLWNSAAIRRGISTHPLHGGGRILPGPGRGGAREPVEVAALGG